MKTDGVFDFRVVHIPAKYGQDINLIFQGDEHFNSHNFARATWERDKEDIKEICKKNPTYFIKTGDTFESFSTSEREYYTCGKFHDSAKNRIAGGFAREIKDYIDECDFLEGRTLAIFGGNHFFQFSDGITSDQALASMLKAPYIGCSGYVILILDIDKHHHHVVKIFCHHGKGSGRRAGSTFNALEDAANDFPDASIVVMGHDHKAGCMQLPAINCNLGKGGHWKIMGLNRIIGRTGSYLTSFEPKVPSYAVDNLYRPSTLGYLHVTITPRRMSYNENGVDDRWVQIKATI